MYQVQPQDFSFIAQAGRAVGNAIEKYPEAQAADKLARDNKIDKDTFDNKIWPAQIEAMQKKATDAGVDPNTALSLSVKYAQKRMSAETPSAAAARIATGETLFNKALEEIKIKTLQQKSAGTAAVPEQPGAQINLEGQRAPTSVQTPYTTPATATPMASPEAARSARLAGSAQQTSMMTEGLLPGDEPQTAQAPSTPAQPAQSADPAALRAEAEKMGLSGNPQAESILNRVSNQQFSLPEGTRAAAMTKQLQTQGGWTPEQKSALEAVPTEKDVMTNNRLAEAEKQRNKLREVLGKMRERRTAAHDLKGDDLKLLNTQINAVEAQISASENKTKLALGLSTGKDVLGQSTYSTGEEWKREHDDAETTYESANALMERIGRLNAAKNPDPNPPKQIPPAKSQFKIVKVQ